MALTVAELNTRLTADTRDLQAGLRRAEADTKSFAAGGGAAMKSFGGAIAGVVATAGFQQLTQFFADAIKGASDLAEAANATGVAFVGATPEVTAWATALSSAFGATNTEALNAASQFQLVAREAGFTATQITDLAERAFDLGSVFNESAAAVSTAIKAGLVGEFQPLQRFGVILSQDAIQAEALAQGLIKPKEQMDAGTKQAVIYSEIMRQTANAQGDAEATAESAAGQMRQLHANTGDLSDSLGVALLPIFTSIVNFMNSSMIPAFGRAVDIFGDVHANIIGMVQALLSFPTGILDAIGLDGFAEGLRGVNGNLEEWRVRMRDGGENFEKLTDGFIAGNAAAGAAATAAKGLSTGIDKVGNSAKEAAKHLADVKNAMFATRDAAYALEDAHRAAADAQDELNMLLASGGVDAEKVARATEDVTEAQEHLNEALADASERILRDVESATNDLAEANEKLADQTQDVADAEAKLSKLKAQKKARDEAIRNAQAQLAAADTVTERIIATDALNAALGMEIVTDGEIVAAASAVGVENDKLHTATDGVTDATKSLTDAQSQQPAQFDSVKDATKRLTEAQGALNAAQQQSPTFARDVADAQREVERANYGVETATWAAEKAQRAYNDALNAQPAHVTTTRNETVNVTRNENVNVTIQHLGLNPDIGGLLGGLQFGPGGIKLPSGHSGGTVPGPRGSEVPMMLKAGEEITPAGGGGGGMNLTVIVEGSVITERDLGRVVADAVRNNALIGVT